MGTQRSGDDSQTWTAGALIYSGRPDPVWPLGEEEVHALLEIWENLEPLPRPVPELARLGYRGSFLRGPEEREWVAFTNSVTLRTRGGAADSRRDVRGDFEARLVRSAPPGTLPEDPTLGVPR